MTDKEILDKFKELELRMKGLEMMIESTHDLVWKIGSCDSRWIVELKKYLKNE